MHEDFRQNAIAKVDVSDLAITHHAADRTYPRHFHQFLLRQPQPDEI